MGSYVYSLKNFFIYARRALCEFMCLLHDESLNFSRRDLWIPPLAPLRVFDLWKGFWWIIAFSPYLVYIYSRVAWFVL